jgi:NADH-ubiquinone oxidoreductase chain 3
VSSIIIIPTFLALGLSLILIILNSSIRKKINQEREKPSPFECGFDPKSSARIPFSLRFYLIAVIFLIFDVEITLIIPLPLIYLTTNNITLIILRIFFILILLAGLYHEWNQGALEWDN